MQRICHRFHDAVLVYRFVEKSLTPLSSPELLTAIDMITRAVIVYMNERCFHSCLHGLHVQLPVPSFRFPLPLETNEKTRFELDPSILSATFYRGQIADVIRAALIDKTDRKRLVRRGAKSWTGWTAKQKYAVALGIRIIDTTL